MLAVKSFVFNSMSQNTYIVWAQNRECVIVDAGCNSELEQEQLKEFIYGNNLKPLALLLTHGHFDHILGAAFICKEFNIEAWLHKEDAIELLTAQKSASIYNVNMIHPFTKSHNLFEENIELNFGTIKVEVMHTPAHSEGSVCFYFPSEKLLFSGDTIIKGGLGFSNNGYASLIEILKQKIVRLPKETKIYCGHGEPTSLKEECESNPFFKIMLKQIS